MCTHHIRVSVNSSQELLKATENLQNCTTIDIVAQEVELTQPLSFSGRYNRSLLDITVTGYSSNNTIVKCKGMKILFSRISRLTISHVSFINCSNRISGVDSGYTYTSGIQIIACSNILLENIIVSEGTGMMLLRAKSLINVTDSQFVNNSEIKSAGGLQIVASNDSSYTISHCQFQHNVVDHTHSTKNEAGAGLIVLFEGSNVSNNSVFVYNSTIFNNKATWGGGMAVYFFYTCSRCNNSVNVVDCTFEGNYATKGGGGLNIGHLYDDDFPLNLVNVTNTRFISNQASNFGGGVALFSNYSREEAKSIFFHGCLFKNNTAKFGSAFDITASKSAKTSFNHKYLLSSTFCDCDFEYNTLTRIQSNTTQYIQNGVFLATTSTVYFCGNTRFIGNWNTALYLSSSTAIFDTNSNVVFEGNRGKNGGALVLYGFSAIFVNTDSTFNFTNNSASAHGGAIYYYSYDQHNYFPSALCFIQYNGNASVHTKDRNINLYFNDNEANIGRAIFASSLHPCLRACDGEGQNLTHALECQATYHYNTSDISTMGTELLPKNLSPTPPGKKFLIDFTTKDELGHPVQGEYIIVPIDGYSTEYFISNTNSTIAVNGEEGSTGNLTLQTAGPVYFKQFQVQYELSTCPPGLVYNGANKTCICQTESGKAYIQCDGSSMTVNVVSGYWAGYLSSTNSSQCDHSFEECELFTSMCPSSYCYYLNKGVSLKYKLPQMHSKIEEFMCGPNRTGTLCRDCKNGTALQYHSTNSTCGDTGTCNYGILLYALSELVPVTILFAVILLFDIKLTSGSLNGFILTVQILQLIQYGEYKFVQQTEAQKFSVLIFELLYGLLNLDLFHSDIFSFCLFKNANILDGIAIKYVTVAYAFILVVFLALVMNYCYCGKYCRKVYRKRRSSAVNAVCAFIVISYAQCAHTTFLILTPLHLYSEEVANKYIVFTFYGGLPFFGTEHLPYALPALIVLLTFVSLLPLLLLVYPIYCKIYNPQAILHPFMETFSSCFKDNHRYFAGIYLLYRLLPVITYNYTLTFLQYYILMELIFIVMLMVHGIAQPYANQWHNFLDGLLYVILILANGFTLLNCINLTYGNDTLVYSWFQTCLFVLPLVFLAVYLSLKVFANIFAKPKQLQLQSESVN